MLNKDDLRLFMIVIAVLTLFSLMLFSNKVMSTDKTKFQIAQHVSPMPNLMMLIQTNVDQLELDNDQLEKVHAWRHKSHKKSKQLMFNIVEIEKEIKESVLDGVDGEQMTDMKTDLLEYRSDLMDLKYQCVTTMQNVLSDKQWEKLMSLRDRQLRAMTAATNGRNEIQSFLLASPMPKYMAIVLMHGDELNLNPDQKQALENWRLKNMNHWAMLFDEVLRTEKMLTQKALQMDSAEELLNAFKGVLAKKQEMATMSLNCRDNMHSVLNEQQWDKVTALFKKYQ